jgi:hypothetical protein
MAIPPGVMAPGDEKKFAYRWANDEKDRIYRLTTLDDWDFVTPTGSKGTKDEAVTYRLGANNDGSPLNAYLLRKPKKFFEADKGLKVADIKKKEDARLKAIPDDAPEESYKPQS